jgi:hypothetical protein
VALVGNLLAFCESAAPVGGHVSKAKRASWPRDKRPAHCAKLEQRPPFNIFFKMKNSLTQSLVREQLDGWAAFI